MIIEPIKLLYISSSENDSHALQDRLFEFDAARFTVVWKESGEHAFEYIEKQSSIEVIVTDDNLTGMSGIDFMRKLKELKYDIPVVFLTVSKDVNLAVEVMRMGAVDYLQKGDIVSRVFPQSLLKIVEKRRLKLEFGELEMRKKRLEAMQEIVVNISNKISKPLMDMSIIVKTFEEKNIPEKSVKYLNMIKENIERMQSKLEQLKNLKEDKTVKYIRDIKMIDLS